VVDEGADASEARASLVVRAGGPGDLADREREARRRGHGVREDDHLACLKSSTNTLYLARHYRQNLVGSLPRGMPKVVDCRHQVCKP
jgi:hypothetical protein